jgi:gas vesicle protein
MGFFDTVGNAFKTGFNETSKFVGNTANSTGKVATQGYKETTKFVTQSANKVETFAKDTSKKIEKEVKKDADIVQNKLKDVKKEIDQQVRNVSDGWKKGDDIGQQAAKDNPMPETPQWLPMILIAGGAVVVVFLFLN